MTRWLPPLMTVLVLALGGFPAAAQSIWPERAENLQVLPENFPPERLRAVMQGFTRALGVRCSYCHVGEDGAPLTTFDFVSDENPNKDRTRSMYRMLGIINQELRAFPSSDEVRVNMWCHTCHNGKPRPQALEEAIFEAWETGRADGAVARFTALRERFYGAAAYDFTPGSVNEVASQLQERGDTAAALRLFERNVADYPGFAEGWERLGDVAAARGDGALARRHYERALESAPGNARIRRKLDGIG